MKEYDTSTHDTPVMPVTVKRNADECYCVKHCKGRNMDWDNEECKQCYCKTIRGISKLQ